MDEKKEHVATEELQARRERRMRKEEEKKEKKGSVKKGILIAVCVILAILLIALIVATAYFENLMGLINRVDDETQNTLSDAEYQALMDSLDETIDENYTGEMLDDVTWDNEEGVIENSEDIINILLIGQDRREGQERQRSDVIILCTINKHTKSITLTSFMRDMYVQIPGYQDNRINVPYVLGGMELLDKCLEVNFGVQVDGNVEVDFTGFMNIIDLMGGIDLELTEAEAKYMNMNVSWDVEDGTDKVWNLTEGMNHLTGSQALSYARMRYVGNGDYERTERQRKVLSLLIEKAKQLSISELNVLMQHALPMLTTDLSDAEIVNYALELFPMLSELTINTLRIPADGTYESTYVREMAVLLPNLTQNREILAEVMQENGQ